MFNETQSTRSGTKGFVQIQISYFVNFVVKKSPFIQNQLFPQRRWQQICIYFIMIRQPSFDKNQLEHLCRKVLDASFRVHSHLGPGLLESAYEACLKWELEKNGIAINAQVGLPIYYMGESIDVGYRLDILVEKKLIIEIKAVETVRPLHKAQLLSYLRLSKLHLGLLINFNTVSMKDGISRIINGYL